MLGGGAHADGAVRADGACTSAPTRRWRPLAASMSSQGPWLRRSSALYSELSASPTRSRKESPWGPTEATASQSARAAP